MKTFFHSLVNLRTFLNDELQQRRLYTSIPNNCFAFIRPFLLRMIGVLSATPLEVFDCF